MLAKIFIILLISLELLGVSNAQSKADNLSLALFKKPLKEYLVFKGNNNLSKVRQDINLKKNCCAIKTPPPLKISKLKDPPITAEGAAILDTATSKFLFEKNPQKIFPIASLTKIMTALIAIENYRLDDVIVVPKEATNVLPGALIYLQEGEKITVKGLLYGLLLYSGNDAALALSSKMGEKQFVEKMNEKAKLLGLSSAHYDDPSGLSSSNKSTTLDLAHLTNYALTNSIFAKITKTNEITITSTDGKIAHPLKNTNRLLRDYQGTYGGKTGYTEEAGHCLIVAVEQQGHKIISVVLKSGNDQFKESREILDWIFAVYRW